MAILKNFYNIAKKTGKKGKTELFRQFSESKKSPRFQINHWNPIEFQV